MNDPTTADAADIRVAVRKEYAEAATRERGCRGPSCCGPDEGTTTQQRFGGGLYGEEAAGAQAAIGFSLGCGVPTQVAHLTEGETVLDLGSGGGADVLISARRVGPGGRAIGLDMTDEMLDLARRNAVAEGVENVEFLKGDIESIPLPDRSVDVVISNCVINLSVDKTLVLREAARVTRPGGRLAVSDVVADDEMDAATRADLASWTGCIAGALTEGEFRASLEQAGFVDIEIAETHRVHDQAFSAIVRARMPSQADEKAHAA